MHHGQNKDVCFSYFFKSDYSGSFNINVSNVSPSFNLMILYCSKIGSNLSYFTWSYFIFFDKLIFDGVPYLILESNPLSLWSVFFLNFSICILGTSFLDPLSLSVAFISVRIVSLTTLSILN